MRIGIITFHRAYNCGAMLQAWALKTVLERIGHTVGFLADNDTGRIPAQCMLALRCRDGSLFRRVRSFVYRLLQTLCGMRSGAKTGRLYDGFRKQFLPETRLHQDELAGHFDMVILGSDQVLNPTLWGWRPYFLCEEVPESIRKICYAGSLGDDNLEEKWRSRIDAALKRFEYISLREEYLDYKVTLDPTMLLGAADYTPVIRRAPFFKRKPYLFMYSCTMTDFEIGVGRAVAERLGLKFVFAHTVGRYCRKDIKESVTRISPDRFLRYIKDAEFVIAGSFHATVFSILFHKRFVTLRTKVDNRVSRPESFLIRLGIPERLATPETGIDAILKVLKTNIPESAYIKLENAREDSLNWLQNALNGNNNVVKRI